MWVYFAKARPAYAVFSSSATVTIADNDSRVVAVDWARHSTQPTPNLSLDNNPNAGGGARIFPDKLTPTDANAADRKLVDIVALIEPPVPGKTVYFRVWDSDDPSASENTIDPTDTGDRFVGGDNRSGFISSDLQAVTDVYGVARTTITVSMQPGDNYRAYASLTQTDRNAVTIEASDGPVTVLPESIRRSDLLTVWRKLNVELDSLGPVPEGYVFPPDDVPPPGNNPPSPSIALMVTNYVPAYVQVATIPETLDVTDDATFVHNSADGDPSEVIIGDTRDVVSRDDFWVVQVFGAYEPSVGADYDPGPEPQLPAIFGTSPLFQADGPNIIYLETIREATSAWRGAVLPGKRVQSALVFEERNVLHETLHHFVGEHINDPHADEGVMLFWNTHQGTAVENQLTQGQLDLVRSTARPR